MIETKYEIGESLFPRITKNTVVEYVLLLEIYEGHGYYVGKYANDHCIEVVLMSEEDIYKWFMKKSNT